MDEKMEETRYKRIYRAGFYFQFLKGKISPLGRDPQKSRLGAEPFEIN